MDGFDSFAVDQENLRRRQAIAEALQTGALAPMEVSQASPLAALAKLGQAYFAKKSMDALGQEKKDLAARMTENTRSGLENFFRTSEGYDAPMMAQMPGADGQPQTRRIAGDPKKAVYEALASGNPMLQAVAKSQLEQMGKGAITPEKLMSLATPESVLTNPTNPRSWQPKRELKSFSPGEVILDASGRPYEVPQVGGKPAYDTITVNGDLYQRTPTGLKKLDNAPRISTNVSVSPIIKGQMAGAEAFWKSASEQVTNLGTIAQQATNNKQAISELKALDQGGIYSNVTSAPKTFLSNLAQSIGVPVDAKKLANTENFTSIATDLWQGVVSKYGGNRGVTKEEALELKKIIPQAAQSPEARQRMYSILENISNRQLQQFDNAQKAFSQAIYADDPRMFRLPAEQIYTPEPTQPSPTTETGAPMSLDDYLKRLRGGQ